jgi:hypothetical protein
VGALAVDCLAAALAWARLGALGGGRGARGLGGARPGPPGMAAGWLGLTGLEARRQEAPAPVLTGPWHAALPTSLGARRWLVG